MAQIEVVEFKPKIHGNGGEKSDAMVNEVLKDHTFVNYKFDLQRLPLKKNIPSLLKLYFGEGATTLNDYKSFFSTLEYYRQLFLFDKIVDDDFPKVRSTNSDSVFLWRYTIPQNWILMPLFKTYLKRNIIAYPHNLESLVPGNKSFFNQKDWQHYEVELLSKCSKVFVLSREEQWLLNIKGVNAEYLPYFPTKKNLQELLEIRKFRSHSFSNTFLIIGTVHNKPTFVGFENLLTYINSQSWEFGVRFIVAGYGTECFKGKYASKFIEIKGSVSSKELNNLFVHAKAVVLNNEYSSGALTRIVELLIAGIPIITNVASKRSYWDQQDVHLFNSFNDLKYLLNSELPIPILPKKNEHAISLFQSYFQ